MLNPGYLGVFKAPAAHYEQAFLDPSDGLLLKIQSWVDDYEPYTVFVIISSVVDYVDDVASYILTPTSVGWSWMSLKRNVRYRRA